MLDGAPDKPEITVLYWYDSVDDVAYTLANSLRTLGYRPLLQHYAATDPLDRSRFLFTYAPWGRIQKVRARLEAVVAHKRPFWIHWSTEDCPDIRLPGTVTMPVGHTLALLDRLEDRNGHTARLAQVPFVQWINQRFHKFRYVGAYADALRSGLMGMLVEYSKVYADYYQSIGLPVEYARWGLISECTPIDEAALPRERDIDVLWIGTRRTRRRSRLLDRVTGELSARGRNVYVVDGVNHPPVYHQERAALLRRAKVTLNLLPTWDDSALAYRWPLVAAHRSLLVTEESLPHAPEYRPGEHYVSAGAEDLVTMVCHYLDHPHEREPIVERAYEAVTRGHGILDSVRQIMTWASEKERTLAQVADKASTLAARIVSLILGTGILASIV